MKLRDLNMSVLSLLACGIVTTLGIVVPASAHHSFAAEYDGSKVVTLTGTVTKVDWMNPHVYFYIDVEAADGKITNWAFEMGPPNGLQRSGWTKNTMKIGDEVTVNGALAKDGSKQVNARTVTLATTGKRLGAASSEGASDGKSQ